jgi:hypothetical protein
MPFINSMRSSFSAQGRFRAMGVPPLVDPSLVTNGLIFSLDAKYPGTSPSTQWQDGSGNGRSFNIDAGMTRTSNNQGSYTLSDEYGISYNAPVTSSTTCTMQFWLKTSDKYALFWSGVTTQFPELYLGAYRSDSKEYHYQVGNPRFFINTVEQPNIYDYIPNTPTWAMYEFKDVDASTWITNTFNKYTNFNFSSSEIGAILMYNRNLSSAESTQNFNALRGRYGI